MTDYRHGSISYENRWVIKNRVQTNPLLICTLRDFSEAGARQSGLGFFYINIIKNATAFTSDVQKYAFKNDQHSHSKRDRFEPLSGKTPSCCPFISP